MNNRKKEAHMSNDARLAVLETTILNINMTLQDIKHDIKRLDNKIDSKFDILDKKIDTKFTSLDQRIDTIQNRLWSNFLWIMGMIIGLAGLIAHTQHWF